MTNCTFKIRKEDVHYDYDAKVCVVYLLKILMCFLEVMEGVLHLVQTSQVVMQ